MKKLIVANWKMQLSVSESAVLAKKIVAGLAGLNAAEMRRHEIVICPDYLAIESVGRIIKSKIGLGAQDSAAAARAALTGEISPANLKALGVKYVILGHSERREHLHENSAVINAKLKAALAAKLVPILCVGEKLTERRAGQTAAYINEQLHHALKGVKIKTAQDLVVAYEPIWAISTNRGAKPIGPEEADRVQAQIKTIVKKILKKTIRVIYGGSAKAENSAAFLAAPHIDGVLPGAASLKAAEFIKICRL